LKEISMKIVLAGAVAALALAGATLVATSPAAARVNFGVSINAGDVQFAYQDGYWDHAHRWHAWRDPEDWRWYREHYRDHYYDWRHDRDRDMGWRVGGPGISIGIGFGDAVFGYRDGYWDRWHRWHTWGDRHDWRRFRDAHPDRFHDWNHDRDRDMGWHDNH
jgi:hypothetical protein